ncbi:MAG TPA: DNA-directed RNA polymerase subunit alpha [Kiritimatiellia bacterium]|jgi:DNA-directed RNA polymerase subunit alpha|nr:DNA-directed RNA polymerase subunit alpha [Lentisphaerota bacterium]HRV31140.1 DNA-directed RNA polymerase subunit alpha [Kiritimatiellia bacterium]
MSTRLSRFEMPKFVVKDEKTATDTYAQFVAEPFEAGYGRTIGNSLRRVLLSSLEGASIASVRIQGAEHEFCHLKGCVEDVTDIVLNLKKILFRMYTRTPKMLRIKVKGPAEVTAADIQADASVEVLNPEQVICTLDDDGVFNAEIEVQIGRGYCPAEWNKKPDQEIGLIPMDTLFSPVRRVKYAVENTRVGRRTDYDKLILDIWTDGRITPDEALTLSAAILRHHLDVFVNFNKDIVEFQESEEAVDPAREELAKKLAISVNEIELSVRAANCLNNANITTVGELAQKTEPEMLKYRNFGKKSLNEIKQKLAELGLTLGMTFEPELLQMIPSEE